MHYSISKSNTQQFLSISLKFEAIDNEMTLKLPLWRPGRYEVQNFAKNIRTISSNLGKVAFVGRNEWLLSGIKKGDEIEIEYDYYAQHKDAGGTWLSDDFCLINFIGCALVPEPLLDDAIQVSLAFDQAFQIVTSSKKEEGVYVYENFEDLTESPILLGKSLHHNAYVVNNTTHHIWLQGNISPDWDKITKDFIAFTKVQLEVFKTFPHPEYHYLCILPTFRHYHGVEHHKNTVITLGPSNQFSNKAFYNNLLGVSSHELFHVWNIKQIRPKELLPYNLFEETYFEPGYIAEGVTTYYGDLCLYRAKVFDREQYRKEINTLLTRHFENQGRFVKSITDSSLELWVDGYEKGIPARKTSIYVKGALIALMLDAHIQKITTKEKSLDHVMYLMYERFGKRKVGYSSVDFKQIIEEVIGSNVDDFFEKYIYGIDDLKTPLKSALEYFGWEVEMTNSSSKWMRNYGIKLDQKGNVVDVAYNYAEDIVIGDKLIAINHQIVSSWEEILKTEDKIELTIEREGQLFEKQLIPKKNMYYSKLSVT